MIEDLQNIELDALHMPIKLMCQNMAWVFTIISIESLIAYKNKYYL